MFKLWNIIKLLFINISRLIICFDRHSLHSLLYLISYFARYQLEWVIYVALCCFRRVYCITLVSCLTLMGFCVCISYWSYSCWKGQFWELKWSHHVTFYLAIFVKFSTVTYFNSSISHPVMFYYKVFATPNHYLQIVKVSTFQNFTMFYMACVA